MFIIKLTIFSLAYALPFEDRQPFPHILLACNCNQDASTYLLLLLQRDGLFLSKVLTLMHFH